MPDSIVNHPDPAATSQPASRTLCLTVGDADGIGPEILLKTLHTWGETDTDQPAMAPWGLRIYGDCQELIQTAHRIGMDVPVVEGVTMFHVAADAQPAAAWVALDKAVADLAQGRACALVTGPIAKDKLLAAGLPYTGHTEMLEILARQYYPQTTSSPWQADMLFVYHAFRVMLLTRHIPLAEVSKQLNAEQVRAQLLSLHHFLVSQMGLVAPRIAVMGANPHAGEIGGQEEQAILRPTIEQLNATTPGTWAGEWEGPLAADGLLRGLDVQHPPYDAYVACYHDQGLIPIKLLGGWEAVNVTIGLPFIRTSVSHGTAPDIVGQGVASPDSLIAAIEQAQHLATRQQLTQLTQGG
ncbi:MAG: 4-hydroxythreonine-4-phosphate dehydrogenase PdxA [Cyanobacteria bacterium HKST-UBA04]|nr:4-hydroxythreonine-4-phosphate dehydrogenase PdxA [Cyanobacteria bacterium HKST-UBA04]